MLHALYEPGIAPDVIVGTSAGAMNGAFIASRPADRARRPMSSPTCGAACGAGRSSHCARSPVCSAFSARATTLSRRPACASCSIATSSTSALEELPIPLHVVAVDVITCEELLLPGPLFRGDPCERLDPGVLRPARGGTRLMDGGVANNTPISHAIALGAQRIYVLPTGHACPLDRPPPARSGRRFTRSASSRSGG